MISLLSSVNCHEVKYEQNTQESSKLTGLWILFAVLLLCTLN